MGLITTCLVACSDGADQIVIPMQHWGNTDVRVETHPNPPVAGMSEIVVIATGLHGRPVPDLTVSLRGDPSMPWVQAIQDGLIGVYRRAIDIGNGQDAVVQVKLQRGQEEKVLLFPVKLAPDKD
jgi:hypothetical protein